MKHFVIETYVIFNDTNVKKDVFTRLASTEEEAVLCLLRSDVHYFNAYRVVGVLA